MCAGVRTVLFLPRRVLLTTVVFDKRDFPDYGGDGPRRSAAMAGRTRHGSGCFGCQPFQVQLQVQRRETAVTVRSGHRNQPSFAFPTLQRPDRDTGKFCRPACADRAFHEHDHYRVLYGKLESGFHAVRRWFSLSVRFSKEMVPGWGMPLIAITDKTPPCTSRRTSSARIESAPGTSERSTKSQNYVPLHLRQFPPGSGGAGPAGAASVCRSMP